jgi:hypothetical protein
MYPILKKYKGDESSYVLFTAPFTGTLLNTNNPEIKNSLFLANQVWDEDSFEEIN